MPGAFVVCGVGLRVSWWFDALLGGSGDLVSGSKSRLISTLKGFLIGVMILIRLQNNYLLSPPTLQVYRDPERTP